MSHKPLNPRNYYMRWIHTYPLIPWLIEPQIFNFLLTTFMTYEEFPEKNKVSEAKFQSELSSLKTVVLVCTILILYVWPLSLIITEREGNIEGP